MVSHFMTNEIINGPRFLSEDLNRVVAQTVNFFFQFLTAAGYILELLTVDGY